jgi:VanZ family protein
VKTASSRRSLWTPVLLYLAFIFALSSISEPPALPQGIDKDLHGLLYCGLGVLLVRALAGGLRGRVITARATIIAALIATLYGITDEIHQHFVPSRQVEALDVVADGIGATAGAIVLYVWGIISGRDGL